MRLLVIKELWHDRGGGEYATRLILNLLKSYFDITVLTGEARAEEPGIHYVYHPALTGLSRYRLWLSMKLSDLYEYIRRADIVYIPRYAYPAIPLAKKLGKRVVVHLHGYMPVSYTSVVLAPYEQHKNKIMIDDLYLECSKGIVHCAGAATMWWLAWLARKWIAQADAVICVSKRHAQIISDALPALKEKIIVAYNPPPPLDTVSKELGETPNFLYVGGDSYIKGFYTVLKIINLMGKRGIKAKFILTNNYGERARRMVSDIASRHSVVKVEVVGYVPRGQLLKLYKEAWAVLVPSIWEEAFSYAVLEAAMSAAVPIASAVGGIPEITAGTPAEKFTVDPGEIPQKALELAQSDPRQVLKDAEKTREEVRRRFSPQEAVKRLLEAFV